MGNLSSNLKKTWLPNQDAKKTGTLGMSMGLRLFLFLVVLVLTMILGIIAILIITGVFTAGISESEKIVEYQLLHASQEISSEYGQLSVQSVELSKALSTSIEKSLSRYSMSPANLQDHPELLEEIISAEYERALFFLQRSKSSGVFLILDATVNPALDNAQNSRAGLYVKNMEPNIISSSSPNITILRGFPSISRSNSLALHAQWNMEFDIADAPYYHRPVEAARLYDTLPLSRLYYWSPALTLPNTNEKVMLCSVPLIDSTGNVFGVCGFEVSAMLFKLSHTPSKGAYTRLFCMLSPIKEQTIDFNQSMFAGGYSARMISKDSSIVSIVDNHRYFTSYIQDRDHSFLGSHTPIQLYPEGSAFSDQQWAAVIMIPEGDVVSSIARLNILLFVLLSLLIIVGITASFILSRRYLKPISKGFEIIKTADLHSAPKTKIPEIDDLIDFLTLHKEKSQKNTGEGTLSFSVLDEFLENTKTLSPAERAVFNLYVKGHTAKEIAEILCLSINTIKTHNRHIYMKLNIASREELLLYVNMLKEIGREIK